MDDKILGYQEGYNARLKELIAERGLPSNSQKAHFVTSGELIERLTQSTTRLRNVGDVIAASDGRTVRFVKMQLIVETGRWERRLWKIGDDGFTVVWAEDPEQVFVGEWDKGQLIEVYNVRSGLVLQSFFICRTKSPKCDSRWTRSGHYLHVHD